MVDLGLTHVALPVSNLNDSIAFGLDHGIGHLASMSPQKNE
jgi:hypothetical protein